jgi:hypothetical protein
MNKLFILIGLMFMSMSVMAGSPYDHIGLDNGAYGSTFTIWVGTTPYKVIDSAYSDEYESIILRNIGTQTAWYDFDSTVSTGTSGQTATVNGYITYENGQLPAGANVCISGKTGSNIYFVTSEQTTGCKINVTLTKRNSGGQ